MSEGSSFQRHRHRKVGYGKAPGTLPSQLSLCLAACLHRQGSRIHSRPDLLASSWNHPRCRPWSHLLTRLRAGKENSLGWAGLAARPICLGICPPSLLPLLLPSPPLCSLPIYPLHPQRKVCACDPSQDHQGNATTEPPVPRGGPDQGGGGRSSLRGSFTASFQQGIPRLRRPPALTPETKHFSIEDVEILSQ